MVRRRSRRRKSSYQPAEPEGGSLLASLEDLSPRARRLVESGVIDLTEITGSGEGGKITSGDILHAARVIEVERSVARIEAANDGRHEEAPIPFPEETSDRESGTSTSVAVEGEPIVVEPSPWEDYNGTTDGLSESVRPGADQSWGEAEAHLAAMAEEAAANEAEIAGPEEAAVAELGVEVPSAEAEQRQAEVVEDAAPTPSWAEKAQTAIPGVEPPLFPAWTPEAQEPVGAEEPVPEPVAVAETDEGLPGPAAQVEAAPEADLIIEELPVDASEETAETADVSAAPAVPEETAPFEAPREDVMMDFGTLEMVDPASVWAEGAEDFAPWFLAHSRQLGDVLGLADGLSDARQFATKGATGVIGRDDNGEEVVVVSTREAVATDSDLGNALGMAASSGASSVALVSGTFTEDQLKALAWLNNQTRSGVKWYGIEMRVVRIADSPAAMLFDLVASPPR